MSSKENSSRKGLKIQSDREEIDLLRERLTTLAHEKAHLQLIVDLLVELAPVNNLDDLVDRILMVLTEVIGGTNVALYYRLNGGWHYADILGERRVCEAPKDPISLKVIETGKVVGFDEDAPVDAAAYPRISEKHSSWGFPLEGQDELVGVLQLTGILIPYHHDFREQLIIVCRYISMALQTAILNYSRLKAAYDDLREQNQALNREMAERKKTAAEKKRLEAELRQSEKMQAIGQLAGGIAHDFNNQLCGILGYADLLYYELADHPEWREYAKEILTAVKRSSGLTHQLLAFARKGKNLAVSVDCHKLIGEVVSLLKRSVDKRIEIRTSLLPGNAVTTGDPSQLQNAILNIALNARDAMPEGGTITLMTEWARLNETDCRGRFAQYDVEAGPFIRLSVQDTGAGMSPEILPRIFEPFFTTKDVGKGTGMGLAAVYGTLRNHRGAIEVESTADRGTTFHLYLPVVEDLPSENDPENGKAIGNRKKAHILVVDDEPVVRTLSEKLLLRLGYAVTICKDGKEAVKKYQASWREIDLVLLDLIMPAMNGRDTFLAMRKINPEVAVLISSGYSLDEAAQGLLDQGVRDFIQKPFKASVLEEKINALIS